MAKNKNNRASGSRHRKRPEKGRDQPTQEQQHPPEEQPVGQQAQREQTEPEEVREEAAPPERGGAHEEAQREAEQVPRGAEEKREQKAPEGRERAPCPVAGVGASAGGLEALEGLFDHMPPKVSMAFVVVQHRASDRTSVMKSLLEKHTQLAVKDIEDGEKVEPGTIYLAPADKDVSIMDGTLYIVAPPPHAGIRLPVDSFLRSLARDGADRAVCIILSGTGSDGTLGLKEIKAAGGLVMAQKEEQAKYDSMPRNAIETGLVDFILPVEKMGEQLAQYIRHPFLEKRKTPETGKKLEDQLQRIFLLIRNETGPDFSHYKRNTIQRRIARRLAVHQVPDLNSYIRLLQEQPEEVGVLAREMLITVTNFFRDREAFEALGEQVLGPLIEEKPPESPLRIWVAGCATGEEAYSIALLVQEQMDKLQKRHPIQIFGTDLDAEAIETARRGQYPRSIAADVSEERLRRFFTEENNHCKVKSNIREMLVFAKHNLIKDAPFSKLDLICCRNVLIYMDSVLQKRLIPMFHYTLNPGGYLFLGESESIGTFSDLFAPVDARHRIFRRKPVTTGYEPEFGEGFKPQRREGAAAPRPPKSDQNMSKIAERVILRDYSLPCVLVNQDYDVVYFNGDTSRYLAQPSGQPTFNIIQMARPEIHYKLGTLLKRAFHEKHLVIEKAVQLHADDYYFDADIVVRPVTEPGAGDNLMLVVFKGKPKEKKRGDGGRAPLDIPEQEKEARIRELEQDLLSTKEYLQTTIEELETSNEELKSSNEELQSTNEELQSTNEELDTSREELQSTNEELRTVNAEHQQKIDELSNAYDDLNNLVGATEVATLFLDEQVRIRRFTPAARGLFRLIPQDVGRPINDIVSTLGYNQLSDDIQTVIEKLTQIEKEVPAEDGKWYQMKISPYRAAGNTIGGAVVTFVDVTDRKKALQASEEARAFVQAIVETVREPLLVLGGDLQVMDANAAFYRHFRVRPEETVGAQVYQLGNDQWDIPELRELLEHIVPENSKFEGFRVTHDFPRLGVRTMLLNARQTTLGGAATGRILLAIEDITDHEKNEKDEGKETNEKR
jgi:two-component system CheB/CheR fusion protein